MPRITVKGKLKRGYGNGTGSNYKSWIKDSEFNSKGTTAVVVGGTSPGGGVNH